jgi:hypothetical protein
LRYVNIEIIYKLSKIGENIVPKHKMYDSEEVVRLRLNPLMSKRHSFYRRLSVENLYFEDSTISINEFFKIQKKTRLFLTRYLKESSREEIEGISAGDMGAIVFFPEVSLKMDIKEMLDESTQQSIFTVDGFGIAKMNCTSGYQIIIKGFEYCTGFFLYNQEQRFCLVGHLPVEEANVVDVVDNILCPLFESIKKNNGIDLKRSKLLLCCGDDGANPARVKRQHDPLPGQLVFFRIRSLCSSMFKEITLKDDHIVEGFDKVIFNSKEGALSVKRYQDKITDSDVHKYPCTLLNG